ncbi:hypothetical protein VWM73_12380, partial [Campylobacter coli]
GVSLDEKNNVKTKNFQTTHEKIFACGDARKGQSLVVWAIKDGTFLFQLPQQKAH